MRFQLRKTPELSFFLDDSMDYIENIDALLGKTPGGEHEEPSSEPEK